MKLIVISGRSGAGKSLTLNTLEDEGVRCIDNMPMDFLVELFRKLARGDSTLGDTVAVSLDVRNLGGSPGGRFDELLKLAQSAAVDLRTVFVDCDNHALLSRYAETRRTHPLSPSGKLSNDALEAERKMLADIRGRCDLILDTSRLNPHQCRQLVRKSLWPGSPELTLILQSFAFRKGLPINSDNVFDLRCLPNPHWLPELRKLDGRHPKVRKFLEGEKSCVAMLARIRDYLLEHLPLFQSAGYKYFTASLGCTGGMHRSVHAVEQLYTPLSDTEFPVVKHHRDLH